MTIESYVYDIPDNSELANQFRQNHPHLYKWLNTSLGRTYLNRKIEELEEPMFIGSCYKLNSGGKNE